MEVYNDDQEVMTAEQAAVFLNVSVASIRVWTRTGVLDCLRYGRTVRYTREQLLAPRASQTVKKTKTTTRDDIRARLKAAAA